FMTGNTYKFVFPFFFIFLLLYVGMHTYPFKQTTIVIYKGNSPNCKMPIARIFGLNSMFENKYMLVFHGFFPCFKSTLNIIWMNHFQPTIASVFFISLAGKCRPA